MFKIINLSIILIQIILSKENSFSFNNNIKIKEINFIKLINNIIKLIMSNKIYWRKCQIKNKINLEY